jgi:hypothetical protein
LHHQIGLLFQAALATLPQQFLFPSGFFDRRKSRLELELTVGKIPRN